MKAQPKAVCGGCAMMHLSEWIDLGHSRKPGTDTAAVQDRTIRCIENKQ